MTTIRRRAFSRRIEEYLRDAASFDQQKFDASLHTVVKVPDVRPTTAGRPPRTIKVIRGLSFSDHIGLVMLLLARAYRGLREPTAAGFFAEAVAEALQSFANPLADGEPACFQYPYFLFHNLDKATVAGVAGQLRENGRIIHETLAARPRFMEAYGGPLYLEADLKMLMEEGAAEDTSGICSYLAGSSEQHPHGTDSTYIAKVSFFLDTRNREIIVITIQGQRIQKDNKERSRNFSRLGHKLHMDPRAYILKNICEIGRVECYRKIKVIRPLAHPMFHDNHCGFKARYEPVIRQAGITAANGCYLERDLSAAAEL